MSDEPSTLAADGVEQPSPGELIAQRFRVEALLGRGGTGWAYRVRDEASGGLYALKLLETAKDQKRAGRLVQQFEREFHSLVELAHPRVVQASDYGWWKDKPFYILELLDGGDLQALAPLPWQSACSIAYDISSALSLLHSRRLLHRDITPRNIRRTEDGKAKLLDFGLLMPMGVASNVSGTPPFVAPELLDQSALDARSDLFSLGCTLYFALTARLCFPVRSFDQLREAWRVAPLPPSQFLPSIPKAVDDLVLELVRIDPASRPKSAAEVMDRLLPLLAAAPDEELSAARSYLSTPQMVGRNAQVAALREPLVRAHSGRGSGFFITGERGVGRSRLLDAFAIEAKLAGATTLRASASDAAAGQFGVAAKLAADLVAAHPMIAREALREEGEVFATLFAETPSSPDKTPAIELRLEPGAAQADHFALQTALLEFFLRAARGHTLAIAVDDLDQIDDASAALLAALAYEAASSRLVYAATAGSESPPDRAKPLAVLSERALRIELERLSSDETQQLLASVFGDVPHLSMLNRRLYDLCRGRPRDCMALAQHLVDTGVIHYAGGSWTIPSSLPAGILPAHIEDAMERRLAALTPTAQQLGLLLSLSLLDRLSRTHCVRLGLASSAEIDRAIDELQAAQLAVGTPLGYALCHVSVARLFSARATPAALERAHRDLARVFEQTSESGLAILYHLLRGNQLDAASVRMQALSADPLLRLQEINRAELELGTDRTANTLMLGIEALQQLQRPPAELQVWRAMIAGMCARGGDATHYYRLSSVWLERLARDSGFDDFQQLGAELAPVERAKRALAAAAARHQSEPAALRGIAPGDAIKQLIGYVIISIAVAARTLDLRLQRSLPPLLEPFEHLSPLVQAMLWNARATCLNGEGKREQARELFLRVLTRMEEISTPELAYLDKVRAAIHQTIAEIDASLGLRTDFIARLDDKNRDPNQRVGAHYIKMVLALNESDDDAAEAQRRDAELLSLQLKASSMFSTLGYELEAHAAARDLTGLKQVRTSIAAMARLHPGWQPVEAVANAHYFRACGDHASALAAAAALRDAPQWQRASTFCLYAAAIEAELLVELKRPKEALLVCEPVWRHCAREGMRYLARHLGGALALAEAALGQHERASARIEAIIGELERFGMTGLQLVRAYEIAARVAIYTREFQQIALCAKRLEEHPRMRGRPAQLLAYERVLEHARRAGIEIRDLDETVTFSEVQSIDVSSLEQLMTQSDDRHERAQRAIEYLCQLTNAEDGYLLLRAQHELECITSRRGDAAPPAVLDAGRNALAAPASANSEAATRPAPDLDGATQAFSNRPEYYTSIPLRAVVDGEVQTVGVAVFPKLSAAKVVDSTWVASALATHLARFCDLP